MKQHVDHLLSTGRKQQQRSGFGVNNIAGSTRKPWLLVVERINRGCLGSAVEHAGNLPQHCCCLLVVEAERQT